MYFKNDDVQNGGFENNYKQNHMKLKHGGPDSFGATDKTLRKFKVNMGDHMAQASAHHACAEHGDLKRPHPPNIGRDI